MSNPITERRQARQQAASVGGPVLTELGDPNFSPSTSSQGQVPAAAAQSRMFDNQRKAQNQIDAAVSMGYDVSTPDWENVHAQAETGFIQDAGNVIGSLVGWIDGPRQAINLMIQDLAGGEAAEGFRNPNFGDYWNTLWGGMEDEEGFQLATGLNPVSGSQTLDMFGWSEADEDDGFGRAMRGIADFGLQVLTDPLTYVTFGLSGLGKKVALQTGRALQKSTVNSVLKAAKSGSMDGLNAYERMLATNMDDITRQFQDDLLAKGVEFGGELPPDMVAALDRYLGNADDVWANIGEVALANRIHKDVIRPLVARDFKNIDSLALDLLPAYAKGGARISVPFTRNTLSSGVLIPGSQGLGRKLVGDPMRQLSKNAKNLIPGYGKLADSVAKGVTKMDQMAPLLRALKNGEIEGWQWQIAATAIDNMHNNVARHTISTELNSQWNRISELAAMTDTELSVIGADILVRLEDNNMDDTLIKQMERMAGLDSDNAVGFGYRELNPKLASAVDETVSYMQETMASYHEALSALDPTFKEKFIDGYIPHSPTKEARQIITALAGSAAGSSGQGNTQQDIFAQILNAAGRGGVAEPAMGAPRHVGRRVGRTQALSLTDDGVVMLDEETLRMIGAQTADVVSGGAVNPNALDTRYLSTPQLNEILEPIVREQAAKHGVPLPANWDGKLFNENPIDTMIDYIDNMTDSIQAWQTVESLRASGLAFKHMTELDVQQVIQNMFNNVVRNASAVQTVKFGKPTQGQVEKAPTSWLESIVDPGDYDGAFADLAGRPRADGIEARPHHATLEEDIAVKGIEKPVIVSVFEDGSVQVIDGHHRIAAAKNRGITEIPVQFRREGLLDTPKNGVNIKGHQTPGWFSGGQSAADLFHDIQKNRGNYAFRSGRKGTHESIEKKGTVAGGIYADPEPAEQFVRHASEPEGDRFIYIYKRDDLSPSIRGPLERGGQIGDIRGAPAAHPVAYYDPAEGMQSLQFMGETTQRLDDMTTYDAHEVFETLPWGAEVTEELSLLHGGANQGRLAGVSRNIEMSIDDSKVMRWESLEDVASTRRLAGRVKSSSAEEWARGVPVPDHSVSVPQETRAYHWNGHTADDGTFYDDFQGEAFKVEDIARARAMDAAEQARAAKRTARTKARRGEPYPVLRAQARKATDNIGAKLHFEVDPLATTNEVTNARRAAMNWLDRQFQPDGVLAGQFNDEGIQSLIDGGMDEYTASVLHDYVGHKLSSLSRDTIEYISKEPAEVFRTRALYDSWERGLNEFIRSAAAVRTADGKLIADVDAIQIAGTKEVREQLAELKRASQVLGSKGYDMAAAVMADVEAYTGVQSIKGYVNPEHFNLAGPAIGDLTIETNVAEWLSLTAKNMGTIYTPEGIAAAKLAANEALKWWRAMATLPRPAFHIRNLVGGSWMNMAFGVKSNSMKRAMQHGMAFRKALSEATGPEGIEQAFARLPKEMQQSWRAAWDHNVLAGFATTEFSNAVTPAGARQRWDWAKAWDVDNFALTRAGGKVMESVEDFLRMSMFLEYYDETVPGSAKVAADMVNAVHFDYSNLTPTETKLKSIIPFFVWTRRNLPLQIQTAVENPRYVQRYRAMMQAMNDNFGGNDETNLQEGDHFSAYAAGTNYKVNPNTPFWARIMIDPDLPISDLLSIPNPEPGELIEYANSLLGPHVSSLVDINAQREFGDVNAPAPFNMILQGLAGVGMYDKTEAGDVRIPYYMRTLMETIIPFSREVADPLTGGPTDPNRQQRAGITPDDNFLQAGLKSMGAQLAGGVGIKMTTPADARGAAYRSDAELDELMKSLRLEGKAPPPGS